MVYPQSVSQFHCFSHDFMKWEGPRAGRGPDWLFLVRDRRKSVICTKVILFAWWSWYNLSPRRLLRNNNLTAQFQAVGTVKPWNSLISATVKCAQWIWSDNRGSALGIYLNAPSHGNQSLYDKYCWYGRNTSQAYGTPTGRWQCACLCLRHIGRGWNIYNIIKQKALGVNIAASIFQKKIKASK